MYQIKTKKFLLRQPKLSDARDMAINLNDKDVSYYVTHIPYPYTLKDAKTRIKSSLKQNKDIDFFIEIDDEVVGNISLKDVKSGLKAEVGYWLAKRYWGKGLMTEILKTVVDFGFKKLKLKRISAKIYEPNIGSIRICEKNGFKLEGKMRNYGKINGKLVDGLLYSLIPEDLK